MGEFKKNSSATDEDYFKLSDHVYDDSYLHKGAEIKGSHNKKWVVIETIDADKEKIKNGLQAIAVVPAEEYKPNKKHYENIIYSFRGTEFGKFDGDLSTDTFQISAGMKKNLGMVDGKVQNLPTSFDSALEFVDKVNKKYEPTSVHTTGHSKGAAEAQYVAAERNFYTTTFAAPNIYRLLSDKAKKRVDEGVMENKAVDYTHKKDAVGNFEQFGAPTIGKQFTTKSNGVDRVLAVLFMGEHPMKTFKDMFGKSGSVRLELEPDEIIKHAREFQRLSDVLSTVIRNIEEFQQKEAERISELKRKLKYETQPGGKYHLLAEYEIDDAIREVAKTTQNGQEYFYNVQLAEELIHNLKKKQREFQQFGEEIIYAANSLRDKDGQLNKNFKGLVR
ncbi:hypothetical protein bcgnr5372_44330 [Bacillus luti]